jgi:hypothetical protein
MIKQKVALYCINILYNISRCWTKDHWYIIKLKSADNFPHASSEGKDKDPIEITLSSWMDLFLAWLIGLILVSIASGILYAAIDCFQLITKKQVYYYSN